MSGPIVAILGAAGSVGKFITPEFLVALEGKRIKELRILTTKRSAMIDDFEKSGANVSVVDYSKKGILKKVFKGVDIVISVLSTGPGIAEIRPVIIDAMAESGVKIYFPSEFGINHLTRVQKYDHELLQGKKDDFKMAKAKGLKTIALSCPGITEITFGPWFGFDNRLEVWTIVGTGDVPVAITAGRDMGKFTVEAALKAFTDPETVPDIIEVYSDMKTLKEYAQEFDKAAGRKTKLLFTPLDHAKTHYESDHDFLYFLRLLFAEGFYDYSNANGNQLLNPDESLWKLEKIGVYAKQTGGRPFKDMHA